MQDSLGIGIDLKTPGDGYIIRSSYPLDYAVFTQSNDRIYEKGKPLTHIFLDIVNSVDQFGRDICHGKRTAAERLLDVGFETAVRGSKP
jgi:hypothetical protein